MRRALLIVAVLMVLAPAGCKTVEPEGPPADESRVRSLRIQWRREDPGAVVLEVLAAGRGLVAMAGGREEGLGPGLPMGIYRDGGWVATVRTLKVDRDLTQAKVVEGQADEVRAGDIAVYLPAHR